MKAGPLSDLVSKQYARWVYPEPILDLKAWLANNWQWFDPSHSQRLFWPDRAYQPDLDILVAGCGANQAAVLAFTNPKARVVGVDVSQPSLNHHWFLKEKYELTNLDLKLLPVEEVKKFERDFDLIVTTGVLHHLSSPEKGIKELAQCLKPDGVMGVMLYAKFGRIGVEMLRTAFQEMDLVPCDASVLMIREALQELPIDHPIRSYLSLAPDLSYDAGLVDTFLHSRERTYTVNDCLELVSAGGLVFQDLFFKAPYYPPPLSGSAFHASIARLPIEKQWSIMERINFRNACHFFLACRPERGSGTYRIDFTTHDALSYVPALRYRCALVVDELVRHDWRIKLTPDQLAVMGRIDGVRTVAQIIHDLTRENIKMAARDGSIEAETRMILETFWKMDFLQVCLGPVENRLQP